MRWAIIGWMLLLAATASYAAPPVDFIEELVVGGLDQPVSIGFLPGDGRMLIVHRQGEISIADPQSNPVIPTPYLTVPDVESSGERGLFSIVFDPSFTTNGFFYVYYTNATSARHRISRFTHSGSSANPASEFVVWEDAQVWSGIGHIGGGLDFGPDGMLYLATGEENDGFQAQDLQQSGGKIIRVAPDGSIPPDNPFVGGAGMGEDESIWALGLRNPLRLHWDLTGQRLFIGDVGQDTFEEIHLGFSGANFGWPICDGPCSTAQFDDPLFHYLHDAQGGAVVAGMVYRGSSFPSEYQGAFFFSDFVQQWIHYLTFDLSGNLLGDFVFDSAAGSVVFLDEGPEGAIYSIQFSLVSGSSEIRRIRYEPESPVIASATADVTSGPGPNLNVNFNGAATDPQMDPLAYRWIFGDGQEALSASVLHAYIGKGAYSAQLEVSDGTNIRLSDPIAIEVGTPPILTIQAPADQGTFRGGDVIALSATYSDPDGVLLEQDLAWEVAFVHNGHEHPAAQFPGVATAQFIIPISDHDFHDETAFQISITATDSDGLTSRVEHVIFPEKASLTVDTSPSGLRIIRDGFPRTAPDVYETLIGFEHLVDAPSPQCLGGTEYLFDSWSDGGAPSHGATVSPTGQTVTATFTNAGPCVRVTAGELALYEFDEGSGTTVGDSSASGLPLNLTIFDPGAVSWLPEGGLSVDSFTQIQSAGTATKLIDGFSATDALTVEAWIQPDDFSLFGPARILALSEGSTTGSNFILGQGPLLATPDRYSVRLRSTATTAFGTPSLDSPLHSLTSDLTQVVFTRDALGNTGLYLNGGLIASSLVAGDFSTWASTPLTLANDVTGDRGWTGDFHLVSFYDRALSASEVARNLRALTPDNTAPTATPDSYQTNTGQTLIVAALAGVLANDFDSDGDAIAASLVIDVVHGTLVFQPDGSFTYDHDGSGNAVDSFVYLLDDGLVSVQATVTIGILGIQVVTIMTDPSNRLVGVGESAIFECRTTPGVPVTFEWERDAVAIPATNTSTYSTPPASLADSGSLYRCVATTAIGAAVSQEALLQVVESDRILSGRIVAYDFLEGQGAVVHDQSAALPLADLTIADLGAVTWLPDGGLRIDSLTSIDSGVPVPKILDSITLSEELTIEVWASMGNLTQFGPARIVAFSQDSSSSGGNFIFGQGWNPTNAAAMEVRVRSSSTSQFGLPSLRSDQGSIDTSLTHLVFTRNAAGTTNLYIDGVLTTTGSTPGAFTNWDLLELTLANEATADRGWLGDLHQVVIFDRALSQTEITQNLSVGEPVPAEVPGVPSLDSGALILLAALLAIGAASRIWIRRKLDAVVQGD